MNPIPLVIAHRGASRYAPENTLAAFRLAAEQGAHAIELDAKLSADGVVIVHHDLTVDRTTNGSGPVGGYTVSRLKSLDAGSFFGPRFAGEPVPTLEEVFDAVGKLLLINVELTNYATPTDRLVDRTVQLIKAFGLEEKIIFSSFFPQNLIRAAKMLPQVPRAILAQPGRKGWWARSFLLRGVAPQAVNPYFTDATPEYIRRQHAAGRKVNVWTVDEPADLERLARAGVDGLITDDPPAAFAALKQCGMEPKLNSETAPAIPAW